MTFLTWAALAIGALVVAPLLAHLLRRRPPRTERFAAVHFVPSSPAVTRRRPSFEDRALLGLRVVAVVLLALLGATPFVKCERLSLARRGGASVALAVVLDDSLSMQAREREGSDWSGPSRFERAHVAARELLEGLQAGDAVALVLAGRPARVVLGATTELGAARDALETVEPSDRPTDLDEAVARAAEALRSLPHVDKRIVVLSDMRDGSSADPPLTVPAGIELWAPLESVRGPLDDCAVTRAELGVGKVLATVACARDTVASAAASASGAAGTGGRGGAAAASASASASPSSAAESARVPAPAAAAVAPRPRDARVVQLREAGRVVAEATVPSGRGAFEVALPWPSVASPATGRGAPPAAGTSDEASASAPPATPLAPPDAGAPSPVADVRLDSLAVGLDGRDAIAGDDVAAVHDRGSGVAVGIVADVAASRPPTGGPPPVEQALAALGLGTQLRLLATTPEQPEPLAGLSVLIIDDAPGFTPEARRALGSWLESGGVMLLALGPHAAEAPLGSGFEPMVPGVVRWARLGGSRPQQEALGAGGDERPRDAAPATVAAPAPVRGIDPDSAALFGPTAEGLADLAPRGRTEIDLRPGAMPRSTVRWADGKPLLLELRVGRGVCFVLTLPFATDESDLALRPAFLMLLEHVVDTARGVGGSSRSMVGDSWTFEGYGSVRVHRLPLEGEDDGAPLAVQLDTGVPRVTPSRSGAYAIELGDRTTRRVAVLSEDELLSEPRRLPDGATASALGGVSSDVDLSRYIALCLLLLVGAELALRVWQGRVTSPT